MGKRKQRKFQESSTFIRSTCPEVSVIIPLYNAEKYVSECLDSLLAQTFTDFEVIVVDDRSTDLSTAIVESYASKFNGRLMLSHMETNTGSGALPRNKGLMLSRGKYVYFMDADDFVTKTALEELYALAKDFDVDVVYCEKFFETNTDGTNLHISSRQNPKFGFVDKPTFETQDLAQRVQRLITDGYWVTPWSKLVRRSFLMEHKMFFPHCTIAEDDIWTSALVLLAKKFLFVPNTIYNYRQSESSAMRKNRTPQQKINFRFNPILFGLKTLDDLIGKSEFFRQNLSYRYAVLEYFFRGQMYSFLEDSFQLQAFEVYETIKQDFGDRFGEHDILIPMLSSSLNHMQKVVAINQQQFNQFATAANKRIAELEDEVRRLRS